MLQQNRIGEASEWGNGRRQSGYQVKPECLFSHQTWKRLTKWNMHPINKKISKCSLMVQDVQIFFTKFWFCQSVFTSRRKFRDIFSNCGKCIRTNLSSTKWIICWAYSQPQLVRKLNLLIPRKSRSARCWDRRIGNAHSVDISTAVTVWGQQYT